MNTGKAPNLPLLHTLRCIGFASQERLASVSGLPEDDIVDPLAALVDLGLVEHRDNDYDLAVLGPSA